MWKDISITSLKKSEKSNAKILIKRQRGHFRSQFCSLLPNWWQLKFSIQNNTVLLGNHGPLWGKSNIFWKIVHWAIFASFCPLLPNFGQTRMFGTQTGKRTDGKKNWWSIDQIDGQYGHKVSCLLHFVLEIITVLPLISKQSYMKQWKITALQKKIFSQALTLKCLDFMCNRL